MVNLTEVHRSNSALKASAEPLVAVFAGATSGIGESTLRALAANARYPVVYIIGRNKARASIIIDECRLSCPEGTFVFMQADLSLLRNVDAVCKRIMEETHKVDILFMSQGYISFEGRKETAEGLDTSMALRYYSRMRLLHKLLPVLVRSASPRVVSVFAAGKEGNFFPSDLSLRSHYSIFNNISHVAFMTTFFLEAVVARYPSISCVHEYPGLVKTAEFQNGLFPSWLKWCFRWIMFPLITPFCVPVTECGERNLFHATSGKYDVPDSRGLRVSSLPSAAEVATGTDGVRGSGVYAVDWDGEVITRCEETYIGWREKGMREVIWEHTLRAFEASEKGQIFLE